MLPSGADVKIGAYEFMIDDTANEPYAHTFESLYSDTQQIQGQNNANTANPNVLVWAYDDFAGGAIRLTSTSQGRANYIEGFGVSTCADPIFYIGTIGFELVGCQATRGGGDQYYAVGNVVRFTRCRAQSTYMTSTSAGFHLGGGSGISLSDCISESCSGYGVWKVATPGGI